LRHRVVVAGLVLAAHGVLFALLWLERVAPRRPAPPMREFLSVPIHLPPLQSPQQARDPAAGGNRPPAAAGPAVAGSARVIRPGERPGPAPEVPQSRAITPEDPSTPQPDAPAPVDWQGQAAELAQRYAEELESGDGRLRWDTFRPAGKLAHVPCRRRGDSSAEVRVQMAALQPEMPDIPFPDAWIPLKDPWAPDLPSAAIVIGGPRPFKEPREGRKSSFRWKKDDTSRGGIALLTPGWEAPPPHDGMFDDMLAGRTPESSVPGIDECDE
jgi:hypothetical protein